MSFIAPISIPFATPAIAIPILGQVPQSLHLLSGWNAPSFLTASHEWSIPRFWAPLEEATATDESILQFRDYQRAQLNSVVETMQAGHDRILMRAPTQTGKTMIIGPLAEAAAQIFPGKTTLVISPYRIITKQILDDLQSFVPQMRIGIIDAKHKDYTGKHDIVLASAFTLGRAQNLKQWDPDRFALVVIDEATFSLAGTWQRILEHLGFLDSEQQISANPGKFLLGLTADPYRLNKVFGTGRQISSLGLRWFMERGYLHKIKGLSVKYDVIIRSHLHQKSDEWLEIPDASVIQSQAVADVYQQHLDDKKTLLFTSSILHAQIHEQVFNDRFGKGYAKAIYSGMPDDELDEAVAGYSDGSGVKVLISIGMLAFGYRARGTEGIIHDYECSSLRRYGQRVGRALGVHDDEEQRTILNIEMKSAGSARDYMAHLARFFNIMNRVADGIEYDPLNIPRPNHGRSNSIVKRRIFTPRHGTRRGLEFRFTTESTRFQYEEGQLQKVLEDVLAGRFAGDMTALSNALDADLDTVNSYLYGALPRTTHEVRMIAKRLGLEPNDLLRVWEQDALEAIEYIHPLSEDGGPKVREFIRLIRRSTLHLVGIGPIREAVRRLGFTGHASYVNWSHIFNGKFNLKKNSPVTQRITDMLFSPVFTVTTPFSSAEAIVSLEEALAEHELKAGWCEEIATGTAQDVINAAAVTGYQPVATKSPDQAYDLIELTDLVPRALKTLTPREEKVIRLRFGIDKRRDYIFDEVADKFEVSRERIRQIEAKALRKLRHPSRSKQFTGYIEKPFWRRTSFEGLRPLSRSNAFVKLVHMLAREQRERRLFFKEHGSETARHDFAKLLAYYHGIQDRDQLIQAWTEALAPQNPIDYLNGTKFVLDINPEPLKRHIASAEQMLALVSRGTDRMLERVFIGLRKSYAISGEWNQTAQSLVDLIHRSRRLIKRDPQRHTVALESLWQEALGPEAFFDYFWLSMPRFIETDRIDLNKLTAYMSAHSSE